MPTGYTAAIANGITFKQYALNCARAFGACIDMRDEPLDKEIPEEFKESKYALDRIEKNKTELEKLKTISAMEAEKLCLEEYINEYNTNIKYCDERKSLSLKYQSMLDKVKNWTPPSATYNSYKNFMITQIEDSIKFDCYELTPKKPHQYKNGVEWLDNKIQKLEDDIKYYTNEYNNECDRVNSRNLWMKNLRNSLPNGDL